VKAVTRSCNRIVFSDGGPLVDMVRRRLFSVSLSVLIDALFSKWVGIALAAGDVSQPFPEHSIVMILTLASIQCDTSFSYDIPSMFCHDHR
jgi:hypothetical protein